MQAAPIAHSADATHVAAHGVHRPFVHQVRPSQPESLVHVAVQPPLPSQTLPAGQVPDGSGAPAATVVQVPRVPASAHDRQGPTQAVLQQAPCAQ